MGKIAFLYYLQLDDRSVVVELKELYEVVPLKIINYDIEEFIFLNLFYVFVVKDYNWLVLFDLLQLE